MMAMVLRRVEAGGALRPQPAVSKHAPAAPRNFRLESMCVLQESKEIDRSHWDHQRMPSILPSIVFASHQEFLADANLRTRKVPHGTIRSKLRAAEQRRASGAP